MIDVKGLQKNYGGLQVLKGVDLTINKGDCVVLVGPSGCGKSTFLRCLNRLEEPDGGHVIFNGKEVTDHDIDHVRQKMGMVFQHFNLFPHLTVKKNITLAPVRLGLMKQPEADKKAMELLERIGLADKADTYPNMLSGGQKQRIAIVRALAMNPDVLLFDEPRDGRRGFGADEGTGPRRHDDGLRHPRDGLCPRGRKPHHLHR